MAWLQIVITSRLVKRTWIYKKFCVAFCVIGCLERHRRYRRHNISWDFLWSAQGTMLILNSSGPAHFCVMNICAGKWSVELDDSGSSFNCIWCCALLKCLLIITHRRLATHLQGSPATSYSYWHILELTDGQCTQTHTISSESIFTHMLTRKQIYGIALIHTWTHTCTHTCFWKNEN